MYFEDREQAGKRLAEELFEKYRYEDCAIISLSLGGVLVAEPVSHKLHTVLTLLLTNEIEVPGEGEIYGGVSQTGKFSYNDNLSKFEINEYKSEFHGYFEEQKRVAFHKLNKIIGEDGLICPEVIRGRNIILIDDGFDDSLMLSSILEYIKPISIQKIIAASPVCSTDALNKLHVSVDEIHILDVKKNYFSTNHYYDNNEIPSQQEIFKKINDNIVNWI